MEKWCERQVKTSDDDGNSFTCSANIAEGRAYRCMYPIKGAAEKAEYKCEYKEIQHGNSE